MSDEETRLMPDTEIHLPKKMSNHSVAVDPKINRLYLTGGALSTLIKNDKATNRAWYIDTDDLDGKPKWCKMPRLPIAIRNHLSFVLQGRLYVCAGVDGDKDHNPGLWGLVRKDWSLKPCLPRELIGITSACTICQTSVYVAKHNFMAEWQTGWETWQRQPDIPGAGHVHGLMCSDGVNRVWILSGRHETEVKMYTRDMSTWTVLKDLPVWRSRTRCVWNPKTSKIIIVGGYGDGEHNTFEHTTDTIWTYDTETQESELLSLTLDMGVSQCEVAILHAEQ